MSVTLTYFPFPGRAFPVRVALGAAGIDFEDKNITFQELGKLRGPEGFNDEFPLGAVPTLDIGTGVNFCQSGALMRWAGKKSGLYPKEDDDLCLFIDEAIETIAEIMAKIPMSKDEEEKKRLRTEFKSGPLIKYCSLLNKRAKGPLYCGESLTLVDLGLISIVTMCESGNLDYVEADWFTKHFPRLSEIAKTAIAHELVQKHGKLPPPKTEGN